MPKFRNLKGQTFGRLTVIRKTGIKNRHSVWLCKCRCGTIKNIIGIQLSSGHTSSCGCFRRENTSSLARTHGMTGSGVYRSWKSMLSRCRNKKEPSWKDYGGRGIKVCRRWFKFDNFFKDMGERPEGKSLDRYPDNDGDYKPCNCRWATRTEQQLNTRIRRPVRFNKETKSLTNWSKIVGISQALLSNRISRGWSVKRALTESIHNTGRKL